jgi:hypothetical protein
MKLKKLKEQISKIESQNPNSDDMDVYLYFNSQMIFDNIWLETNKDKEVEIHWMC